MRLAVCPISISDAKAFVAARHRHHEPPAGGLFAADAARMGQIAGVAILGRAPAVRTTRPRDDRASDNTLPIFDAAGATS